MLLLGVLLSGRRRAVRAGDLLLIGERARRHLARNGFDNRLRRAHDRIDRAQHHGAEDRQDDEQAFDSRNSRLGRHLPQKRRQQRVSRPHFIGPLSLISREPRGYAKRDMKGRKAHYLPFAAFAKLPRDVS